MGITYQIGNYRGRLVSQKLGQTSNGNSQLVFTFTILGQIDLADPDGALIACPNYNRSVFRVITDKTIQYVTQDIKRLITAAGLSAAPKDFDDLDERTPGFLDLRGTEIDLYCQHDNYQGEDREKWQISHGGSGGPEVKPLDSAGIRKLNAMFGKQLQKETAAGKPADPKPPSAKPNAAKLAKSSTKELQEEAAAMGADDGDVPF